MERGNGLRIVVDETGRRIVADSVMTREATAQWAHSHGRTVVTEGAINGWLKEWGNAVEAWLMARGVTEQNASQHSLEWAGPFELKLKRNGRVVSEIRMEPGRIVID